jgi:phosphatidate cytidylyltransferase
MLRTRIITALVLLALLLPALAADDPTAFVALTGVAIGAAGWEWARLNSAPSMAAAVAFGAGLAVVCWIAFSQLGTAGPLGALWWIGLALWAVGGGFVLRGGPDGWGRLHTGARWVLGLVVLALGWLALARARIVGVNFLLSILCIVWAADVAAYFGGRAFGKRKLAPRISPGKSWAGVYSGIVGVLVLALGWLAMERAWPMASPSIFGLLRESLGWPGLVVALAALAGLSVVGDLFESLVKRAAGAKDSSQLLPGHGGVLDRIDALLPVLPAALALATL